MTLNDYLTEVAQRASKKLTQVLTNGETLKQHLRRGFNLYNKDFNNRFLWPWRWKDTAFQTVLNYETGSVEVTKGSRIVTGTGTSWTSDMEGRFLKLTRDNEMYEVLNVSSGTDLVLSLPYIKDSSSGLAYLIWKKYYYLDPDVPYSRSLNLYQWPHEVNPIGRRELDALFNQSHTPGFPEAWALSGIDRKLTTYNTGNITVTAGSRTMTGVGTSFMGNVFGGSKVIIGANSYNVESVDSDTQITLIQKIGTSISNSTYKIETKNRTRVQLSSSPDPVLNIYAHYPRKQYDLVHDEDESEVWEGMEHVVVDVLYGYYLEKLTSDKAFNWLRIYRDEAREAWRAVQEMNPIEGVQRGGKRREVHGYRPSLYGR